MPPPNIPFPDMADQSTTSTPAAGADDKPLNVKLLIPKNDGKLAEVGRLAAEA